MHRWITLALLLLALATPAAAEPIEPGDVYVVDGDTIAVYGLKPNVRLVGFIAAIVAVCLHLRHARGEEMPPPMQPRSTSPYFEVLKNVPTELRGMWCIHHKSDEMLNEWTGRSAKEFALKRCTGDVLPDVTIVSNPDYIHLRAAVRCHVDRVARLISIRGVHVLTITCQSRTLRNDYLIGDYPHPIFVWRVSSDDLRIIADFEIDEAARHNEM